MYVQLYVYKYTCIDICIYIYKYVTKKNVGMQPVNIWKLVS